MHFLDIKEQEKQNMMPTYGRFEVAIVKGKGVVAQDSEGKSYIDFTSGIGVNALGFCDDQWIAAIIFFFCRRPAECYSIFNSMLPVKFSHSMPI